uniref:restriction endonuclease subunit S n=1 Tax=Helicobacter salomonis TaxID=56878 RepID=UPI0018F7E575
LHPNNPSGELVGAIHYGEIHTFYNVHTSKTKSFITQELAKKLKPVNAGDIILTTTSEDLKGLCKAVAWLGDSQIVTGGHATIFRHNQNPKYLAYWFQAKDFIEQKRKIAYGAKVTEVKPSDLARCVIPLPPLVVQEKIVEILDQFNTLTTDLQAGLPAEIEAREKQYSYYLNALLNF